jgi:hypothetical protein
MELYYFDASALVKYYVLDPGSTWVRGIINPPEVPNKSPTNIIFIAEISVPEVAAAFARVHRTGRIRQAVWDGVFNMDDVSWRYQLMKVDRDDFFAAALLTRRHPLKGYDAVQLAVALHENTILTAHNLRLTFVSGDGTLLAAAQAEGLLTDNPFDHVSPLDTLSGSV